MKIALQTRLLFLKKHWMSTLFWLLFPLLATWFIMVQFAAIQADTKVPVGIVLEEETMPVQHLLEALEEKPHIRPVVLTEREAINQLQTHELDSVFIIRSRYEENIQKGSRNQLIKSYYSDLSFAYTPLRETVISYVQQDYSRSKAATFVQRMGEEFDVTPIWSHEELIERSKEIEQEQKLLEVDFTFTNTDVEEEKDSASLFEPWSLWAVFSLLATFMLFDWVIKERKSPAVLRFAFSKLSFKNYLLLNMMLYTGLLFLFDLLTMGMFYVVLDQGVSGHFIVVLLSYRFMITSCIFIISLLFHSTYLYYTSAFAIVLLAMLVSGALIPIDGITGRYSWFEYINPLTPFLSGTYLNIWFIIGVILIGLWYLRKGEADA